MMKATNATNGRIHVQSVAKLESMDAKKLAEVRVVQLNGHKRIPHNLASCVNAEEMMLAECIDSELPDIHGCHALHSLSVSNTLVTAIPRHYASLSALAHITLAESAFSVFPEPLLALTSLRTLDLRGNHISHIPSNIQSLQLLSSLHLDNNALTSFPISVTRLPSLVTLTLGNKQYNRRNPSVNRREPLHLRSSNNIESIPHQIARLSNLQVLRVTSCGLKRISRAISHLRELTTFDIYGALIQHIPVALCRLRNLQRVNIRKTEIACIPYVFNFSYSRNVFFTKNVNNGGCYDRNKCPCCGIYTGTNQPCTGPFRSDDASRQQPRIFHDDEEEAEEKQNEMTSHSLYDPYHVWQYRAAFRYLTNYCEYHRQAYLLLLIFQAHALPREISVPIIQEYVLEFFYGDDVEQRWLSLSR